jgi:hypothetical protein
VIEECREYEVYDETSWDSDNALEQCIARILFPNLSYNEFNTWPTEQLIYSLMDTLFFLDLIHPEQVSGLFCDGPNRD